VEKAGKKTKELYAQFRGQIPTLEADRVLHYDITKAKKLLKSLI